RLADACIENAARLDAGLPGVRTVGWRLFRQWQFKRRQRHSIIVDQRRACPDAAEGVAARPTTRPPPSSSTNVRRRRIWYQECRSAPIRRPFPRPSCNGLARNAPRNSEATNRGARHVGSATLSDVDFDSRLPDDGGGGKHLGWRRAADVVSPANEAADSSSAMDLCDGRRSG